MTSSENYAANPSSGQSADGPVNDSVNRSVDHSVNHSVDHSVNRIDTRFATLAAASRKAFLTYLVAGDPAPECTVAAMHALVAGGADLIELGVPFSDPEAEGPTIQAGHERALRHGCTLQGVLAMVADFRRTDPVTPLILMGYLNSVERPGYAAVAAAAAAAGVDGLLMVNLPPEEASELRDALRQQGLHLVLLLAPTTTSERAQRIAAMASGFLYFVSLKGITGADHLVVADVRTKLAQLRPLTTLPLVIGFGVKDAAVARAVAPLADGVVVGSAIVAMMGELAVRPAEIPGALRDWAGVMRRAIDA